MHPHSPSTPTCLQAPSVSYNHSLLQSLSPTITLSYNHSLLPSLSSTIKLSYHHSLLQSLYPTITLSYNHSLLPNCLMIIFGAGQVGVEGDWGCKPADTLCHPSFTLMMYIYQKLPICRHAAMPAGLQAPSVTPYSP